ncbi:hypothetical protein MLB1_23215 [Mycobacteroides sp. LB1]|nr:hypothetical protein [Mycobacteroides sp. LB1]
MEYGSEACLLPVRDRISGPATARKLQKTFFVYFMVFTLGVALAAVTPSTGWRAFGLGLIVPGGGFWYAADVVMALVSVAAVVVGGLIWILTGAMFVWPIAWIATAALAAHHAEYHSRGHAHHGGLWHSALWMVPLATAGVVVGSLVWRYWAWQRSKHTVEVINRKLVQRHAERIGVSTSRHAQPDELTEKDMAFARYTVNLALQPFDSFEGFDLLEQFQGSSLRYQLFTTQLALANYQASHAPAFGGYLAEAQHALITKMTHRKVWGYWFWESLIGNFRVGHDPIVKDNVMFSGYLATMLGAYQTVTGDSTFDQAGSLSFHHKEDVFEYDQHRVAHAVLANMLNSNLCLYPCEPNFVYPVCNSIALAGLASYDHNHGTGLAQQISDRFRDSLENNFMGFSGRLLFMRSSRLGLTLPTLRMAAVDAAIAMALLPVLPDIATRTWEVMRMQVIDLTQSIPKVKMAPWERVDPGTYRPSLMTTYSALAAAAGVMGDTEVLKAMLNIIDATYEPVELDGAMRFPKLSVVTNIGYISARFYRATATNAPESGPRLAQVAFPDVMVVSAHVKNESLYITLQPGNGPQAKTKLKFENLDPGVRYLLVNGAVHSEITASSIGESFTEISLNERSQFILRPARHADLSQLRA